LARPKNRAAIIMMPLSAGRRRAAAPRAPAAAAAIAPLLPIILLTFLLTATIASAQPGRLSAFLTPSDIAALKRGGADPLAASTTGKAPLLLDAPAIDCAPENTTSTSAALDVCAGETGAPFGILVEWMNVVAFARNNGWLRANDPRLCRVRLTAPVAPGTCPLVVIGGEAMLGRLDLEPRPYPEYYYYDKEYEKSHERGGNHAPPPLLLPGDAVLGDEACREGLAPDTFYVFRARARGTVDALRKEEGGKEDEEGKKKKSEGGHGDDPRPALPAIEPSLWSDNEVCSTLADVGEGEDGCVPPPLVVTTVDLGA
jgi:hypothetical protein